MNVAQVCPQVTGYHIATEKLAQLLLHGIISHMSEHGYEHIHLHLHVISEYVVFFLRAAADCWETVKRQQEVTCCKNKTHTEDRNNT